MRRWWLKTKLRLYRGWLRVQWLLEAAAIYLILALCKALGIDRASSVGGYIARKLGPLIAVSGLARRQIEAAYPGIDADERDRIVRGVWDNFGRYFTEYAHLATLWPQGSGDEPPPRRPGGTRSRRGRALPRNPRRRQAGDHLHRPYRQLGNPRRRGGPLPPEPGRHVPRPNNPIAEKVLLGIRGEAMGKLIPAGYQAALVAARVLEQGGHLGMLMDQHFSRGVSVPFFGRNVKTATTLAKLARRFKCPVYGAWAERIDGCNFRVHMTEALDFAEEYEMADARAAEIAITAKVTAVIEDWVRARPDQWNWLHRRWRWI